MLLEDKGFHNNYIIIIIKVETGSGAHAGEYR